jgi:threonine/homoserine/homoserine lactone efflux protein
MHPLAAGSVLGFSIAAPVGPIGLLVLRRSLAQGVTAGFVSGLGAATADLCYGALAAFGITFLAAWQAPAALLGGGFLCWLAWRTWRGAGCERAAGSTGFAGTFALTLSNPMTILSFAAMVAGTGATSPAWFLAGVFAGSVLWWAMLAAGAGLMRERLSTAHLVWLNRGSAMILLAFGVSALSTAVRGYLA